MNKQIILTAIFSLFFVFHSDAQCPEATGASVISLADVGGGQCRFRLEVSFETYATDNTSIKFTVAIAGGAKLFTTDCYEDLILHSSYTTPINDPSLIAPCDAEIEVTYTAYSDSPTCDGSPCAEGHVQDISLPIDLVSFIGYEEKFDRIKLEWMTASEDQNDYFSVERSGDGSTFEEIGILEGQESSSSVTYYSFMDEHALRGENYYRLKQFNLDNTYEYSKVILVENKIDKSKALTLAPSIIKNEVTLIFNELPKANRFIEVFNMNGTNIITTQLAEGAYTLNLDLSAHASGMYFIRVPIGKEFVVKKFIKAAD